MLHAAVIGFPSTGKTTLFQLMTSIHDAPRGKGDVNIGISKVPDDRLDRLTAMYNPRKRVPATVEFTDIIATARTGANALMITSQIFDHEARMRSYEITAQSAQPA